MPSTNAFDIHGVPMRNLSETMTLIQNTAEPNLKIIMVKQKQKHNHVKSWVRILLRLISRRSGYRRCVWVYVGSGGLGCVRVFLLGFLSLTTFFLFRHMDYITCLLIRPGESQDSSVLFSELHH